MNNLMPVYNEYIYDIINPMNESFSQTPKVEVKPSPELSKYNNFLNRLNSCKEYIKTLPENIKKGGMITILFSMGIFNVAEAQNADSNLNKIINDLESGKIKIENVTDSIYLSHKQNIDSTFSYVESTSSTNNGKENVNEEVFGPDVSGGIVGDTVSLGDYEAVEYGIYSKESHITDGKENYSENMKSFSAIKPILDNNKNLENNKFLSKGYGKTKQSAMISAISGLASFKNTEIVTITNSKGQEKINLNESNSHESEYVTITTSDSKKTTLNNVKVVVIKTAGGFSVEAFCN